MVHLFKLNRLVEGPSLGTGTGRAARKGRGPSMRGILPLPTTRALVITGTTRDSGGSALGNCDVHLFRAADDTEDRQTISDGSGLYTFQPVNNGNGPWYAVAYKAGAPDVAGTTVNTLTGS